jgi:hypothetical protein
MRSPAGGIDSADNPILKGQPMSITIYLASLNPTFVPSSPLVEKLSAFLRDQELIGEEIQPAPLEYGRSYAPGSRAWALFNEPGQPREQLIFERLTLGLPDQPKFLPQTIQESFRLFCPACKQEIPAQLLRDELDRVAWAGGGYQPLTCPHCQAEIPLHGLRSTVAMGLSRFFIEIAGSPTQQLNGGLIARLDALVGRPMGVLFGHR